jgi:hypothetical protein
MLLPIKVNSENHEQRKRKGKEKKSNPKPTTYIRPIISDRIFLYALSDKNCLYFTMNSYVEKRGM